MALACSEACWLVDTPSPDVAAFWHAYYEPLQKNITRMRAEYAAHSPARDVLDTLQHEIDLFRAHETEYSYAFYVMWV